MKKKFFLVPILTLLPAVAQVGWATSIWVEGDHGDAGKYPWTAQVTQGSGALDEIKGKITAGQGADLFEIWINNPAAFSATATIAGLSNYLSDPQLFLFDLSGHGVETNDNRSDDNLLPKLKAGNPDSPLASGWYFLGISGYDNDPVNNDGRLLFRDLRTGIRGPNGPGGSDPIDGWTGGGSTGTYRIQLTGASFAVPEPATLLLVGLGLAAALARKRFAH